MEDCFLISLVSDHSVGQLLLGLTAEG